MLFEQLGITKKDNITCDLTSNQVKKLPAYGQNYYTCWQNYEPLF